MADEIAGTVAPQTFPIPQWLKDFESPIGPQQFLHLMPKFAAADAAPASYQKVEIFNFIFLGKSFEPAQYNGYDKNPSDSTKKVVVGPLPITGVTNELRTFLLAAQRDIFQGYAAHEAQRGGTVTKAGFVNYCGVIGPHKAFQPRDGKHKRGAAIDIDAKFNPFTVTGENSNATPLSGETPANFRTGGRTPTNLADLAALRKAAMVAYENALDFTFGTKAMDMKFRALTASDSSEDIFERYDRVNRALRLYMNCGFEATKNNTIAKTANPQPRSLDGVRDQILNGVEGGFFERNELPFNPTDQAALAQFQSRVAIDHAAMRKVCIYGSWTLDKGVQTFTNSRDPCYGIMSLRKHVAKCLLDVRVNNKRLRWGAVHFGGDESGDMMHFDLGTLADNLQATSEPNPNGIFFAP